MFNIFKKEEKIKKYYFKTKEYVTYLSCINLTDKDNESAERVEKDFKRFQEENEELRQSIGVALFDCFSLPSPKIEFLIESIKEIKEENERLKNKNNLESEKILKSLEETKVLIRTFHSHFNLKEDVIRNEHLKPISESLLHLHGSNYSLEKMVEIKFIKFTQEVLDSIKDMHFDLSNQINPERMIGSSHSIPFQEETINIAIENASLPLKEENLTIPKYKPYSKKEQNYLGLNILRIIDIYDGKIATCVLQEHLKKEGIIKKDNPREITLTIGACLTKLRKKGLIKNVTRGLWERVKGE